jgi:hypothetical protein
LFPGPDAFVQEFHPQRDHPSRDKRRP